MCKMPSVQQSLNHSSKYTVSGKKTPFVFLYISKNCVAIFIIFGVHHPSGSRNWVIKHFTCIITAGVRNDDVIVTSVKMLFTAEDKHVINVLCKDKQYSSRRLLKQFPSKKWTMGGLDHLLQKNDDVGSNRCTGSGRPRTVRMVDNVDAVADLVQSLAEQPQTHRSVRQIACELSIPHASFRDVTKQDLKLKCSIWMS